MLLAHDIFVNVLLSIPLALFIARLKPKSIWVCVLFSVITIFVIGHYHLFFSKDYVWQLSDIALGWGMELYSLPIAMLVVVLLAKRGAAMQD